MRKYYRHDRKQYINNEKLRQIEESIGKENPPRLHPSELPPKQAACINAANKAYIHMANTLKTGSVIRWFLENSGMETENVVRQFTRILLSAGKQKRILFHHRRILAHVRLEPELLEHVMRSAEKIEQRSEHIRKLIFPGYVSLTPLYERQRALEKTGISLCERIAEELAYTGDVISEQELESFCRKWNEDCVDGQGYRKEAEKREKHLEEYHEQVRKETIQNRRTIGQAEAWSILEQYTDLFYKQQRNADRAVSHLAARISRMPEEKRKNGLKLYALISPFGRSISEIRFFHDANKNHMTRSISKADLFQKQQGMPEKLSRITERKGYLVKQLDIL